MISQPNHITVQLVSKEQIRDIDHVVRLCAGFKIIVEGDDGKLPLNPKFPPNFNDRANEDRSSEELAVWWDRPFVEVSEDGRYHVRCLDGGAWDRPTSYGWVDKLADAPAMAETKLNKWRSVRSKPLVNMDPNDLSLIRMPQHPLAGIEVVRQFSSRDEMSAYLTANPDD